MTKTVLVIEDEVVLGRSIQRYLDKQGYDVHIAVSGKDALAQLADRQPEVVLLDYNLPDTDGLALLPKLLESDESLRVIFLTGHGSIQVAVEAMRLGAADYLNKPLSMEELAIVTERALGNQRMRKALDYYQAREAEAGGMHAIKGKSPRIAALRAQLQQLLKAEQALTAGAAPAVLITGETGTGKELVARALHFDSNRSAAAFVEINCSTLPEQLIESELFGHERGAFTDAREARTGLIEAADGGTLFLDEIGEMPLAAQAKLLKVLEDKTLRRVGSTRDRSVNVRIVAATNRNLQDLIDSGHFRSDLFYRLAGIQLALPPLRERGDDVVMLAESFLAHHGRRYGRSGLSLSEAAKSALTTHVWPGNVRELLNCVERAVMLSPDDEISPDALGLASTGAATAGTLPGACGGAHAGAFTLPDEGIDIEQVESRLIEQALEKSNGNVTRAARLLKLSRDTMRYRMEKFGLQK